MIRRDAERSVAKTCLFNGQGEVVMHKILNTPEELYGKGRVFSHVVLEKGVEIGWHIHHGDGETYYILKGVGEYNDNGTVVELYPGDVAFVDEGEGHSLINRHDEPLEVIALVLYK